METRHRSLIEPLCDSTVFAVDDLWFKGTVTAARSRPSVNDALAYRLEFGTFESIMQELAIARKRAEPKFELNLLASLIELCASNNLGLTICDFSYFEEIFVTANRPGNAVLLDVYNSSASEDNVNVGTYGIDLLERLLLGVKPDAEIAFVTQYPEITKYIEAQLKTQKTKWWNLKTLHVIEKKMDMRDEVEPFVVSFVKKHPTLTAATRMARYVIANPENHPELCDIAHYQVPLAGTYDEAESFKALYYWHPNNPELTCALYYLQVSVFVEHLRLFGFNITTSESGMMRLPVQPGAAFVLLLVQLLNDLQIDTSASIALRCERGVWTIAIPILGIGALRIKHRLLGSYGGETIRRLKSVLTCSGTAVLKLAGASLPVPWAQPPRLPGSKEGTERVVVEPSFFEETNGTSRLELTWSEANRW